MSGLATVDGLTPEPTSAQHDENLKLRFWATRCEPNLAAPFFARGGQLGSAVARDETFFAVSGSTFSTGAMVNDTASVVEIELPPSLYRRDLTTGAVQLSTRSRLNMSACRVGAAINGTVSQTLSGQGTVPIYELFTEVASGAAGAWTATGGSPAAASAPASAEASASRPSWANRMQAEQRLQQAGQVAAHSLSDGDRGSGGVAPSLQDKDE